MHVVFVHRGVYPERIGGTYSYIYELGRRLAASGHTVRVIANTREDVAPEPYLSEGMWIHTYAFPRRNRLESSIRHLTTVSRMFEQIHDEQPIDVLSVHEALLGWQLARTRVGRSVCQLPTFHAPGFLEFRLLTSWQLRDEPSWFKRAAKRLAASQIERSQRAMESGVLVCANGIHVLSRYSKEHIENQFHSVDTGKVEIIPGGVDSSRFRPADDRDAVRELMGIPPETIEILTVRNLSPRMGLENLVTALHQVIHSDATDRGNRLHLTICGDGLLRGALENQIESLSLSDRVTLAGRVTDDELVQRYQAADLFVLPTAAMEGFGISTVEALSCNLPVIGTPAGATPEILLPIDERLVTRDTSADAIADAMLSWLNRSGEGCGSTYRDEVLAKYDWDTVARRMESWYESELVRFRSEDGR